MLPWFARSCCRVGLRPGFRLSRCRYEMEQLRRTYRMFFDTTLPVDFHYLLSCTRTHMTDVFAKISQPRHRSRPAHCLRQCATRCRVSNLQLDVQDRRLRHAERRAYRRIKPRRQLDACRAIAEDNDVVSTVGHRAGAVVAVLYADVSRESHEEDVQYGTILAEPMQLLTVCNYNVAFHWSEARDNQTFRGFGFPLGHAWLSGPGEAGVGTTACSEIGWWPSGLNHAQGMYNVVNQHYRRRNRNGYYVPADE